MNISVIIPNYNGQKLLEKNLPLLFESFDKLNPEVIIVDDASTDGSLNKISSLKLPIKVIHNKQNMGFAYSCNLGVKESKGEIIVLLNNDVVPQKGFLDVLVTYFNDPKVFAVGCQEINGEIRGRSAGFFKNGFLNHKRADNQEKTNTLWVSGGSGAFRREAFLKLGGFDELYKPFYWEDIDLSYRALKLGYKILFVSEAKVNHNHEQTIGKFFDKIAIETISYRNSFSFIWKNITDTDLITEHILWLPINIVKACLTRNKAFIKGFGQALKLLPLTLDKRNKTIKFFIKKDKDILREFANE